MLGWVSVLSLRGNYLPVWASLFKTLRTEKFELMAIQPYYEAELI